MGEVDAEGAYGRMARSTLGRAQGKGEDVLQATGVPRWSSSKTRLQPMADESMGIHDRRLEDLIGYLHCSFIGRHARGQSAVCMNGELHKLIALTWVVLC